MLDQVGQWLDDEDLKVATMVCKLFQDIFFCKYLRCNKFSPHQSFISLQGLSNFRVFWSYHHFSHWPWQPYLSAYFSRGADADTELLCLAYALAQFPARAFRSISLCFSRYNLVHAETLTDLLAALVPIQCANLTITTSHRRASHWCSYATTVYPHGLELDQPDDRGKFKLYPLLTTPVWCITASWRSYASLPRGHFHHSSVEDAIEHNYLP